MIADRRLTGSKKFSGPSKTAVFINSDKCFQLFGFYFIYPLFCQECFMEFFTDKTGTDTNRASIVTTFIA